MFYFGYKLKVVIELTEVSFNEMAFGVIVFQIS